MIKKNSISKERTRLLWQNFRKVKKKHPDYHYITIYSYPIKQDAGIMQ
jgi:hypothetical protein